MPTPAAKAAFQLQAGRERSLLRRHPWVFSGAIAAVAGEPEVGATVDVLDSSGRWLARGAFSPESQIAIRVWTFDPAEQVDQAFFEHRLVQALNRRQQIPQGADCSAMRLVNGESDGLPGIVVDRYADVLVVQLMSAGAEYWKAAIVAALRGHFPDCAVYERSDGAARQLEGLAPSVGLLAGDEPPPLVEAVWAGLRFGVDLRLGHKTGAYLDQSTALTSLRGLAAGREVLDCFCYNGAFTLAALQGGAQHVTSIDSSAAALEGLRRNLELNGLEQSRCEARTADVFEALRSFRDSRRSFDLIILDPPKFADSQSHVARASRAYKDINLLAFKLLRPGGLLATFSCSGAITPDLFQKIVAGAALDAGRDAAILANYSQAPDHPVALSFPEGLYLKGLLCG